jgi:D-beta-D-heptose 7-phosphate kinase/D-beta-D-heptose 1-phosphate adenosyltransferase
MADCLSWRLEAEEIRRWRGRDGLVFTNGVFDILHAGHVTYLRRARALGKTLVVGVNTDASVKRLKGSLRPVMTQEERCLLLGELRCVDRVFLFDEDTPLELIRALRPRILVKGADYAVEEIVGAREVREAGGEVRTLPLVEGLSTTELLVRMRRIWEQEQKGKGL